MGFIVKNTTFCNVSELICPHTCRGCGSIGNVFCECCKNDIILDHINYCPLCKRPILDGKCPECWLPPCYMVDWRDGEVGRLIHDYKYHSVRAIGDALADLLDNVLPYIDGDVAIVPLPTTAKHIRARGFDHTAKIAAKLARRRHWHVEMLLSRAKDSVQVGAGDLRRKLQAAEAYSCTGKVVPERTYILFDDVWTTGASMKAALKKLQQAGASKIILAVLAVSRTKNNK